MEVLPIVLEIERETFLLVIVYRMPGPVGDFNYDQVMPENVNIDLLIQKFNFSRHSQYSIHGGILDFVFDNSNSNTVFFAVTVQ